VRTLPLRLSPLDGESLPGYVVRYSHTFAIQPGDVVRALGLNGDAGRVAAAGRYGVTLSADQLARAAQASGLGADRLQAMLLASFVGRAFPRSSVSMSVALAVEAHSHEVLVWSSRFCPQCLREDGAWLLRWQLGWSLVCVRHRALLLRCCPDCGGLPRIGRRAKWPRDDEGEIRDPSQCSHRHEDALCRTSFAAAKAVDVASNPALLAAQRRIDELLDGKLHPTLAGEELEPTAYLRDLRALSYVLRNHTKHSASRPQIRSDTRPSRRAQQRLLDDPGAFSSVLPEALRLADLPDRATLAESLREFADQCYRTEGEKLPPPRNLGNVSPPLVDALRRARSKSVYATASSRIGLHPRAHQDTDDLDDRLQARHVPQLFWAPDYERELSELFNFKDLSVSARFGRSFCSVLLARLLMPLTWQAAAGYLDLPERFINDSYKTTFVELLQNDRYDELLARIKRFANKRAEHGLIDYKQRRARLSDWTGIDPQTWQLLQPHSRSRTPARSVYASVWLWCELTDGHPHAAPLALPDSGLSNYTRCVQHFRAPLRERLLLFGELLLKTPADARQTLPTQLAAALHQGGHLRKNFYLDLAWADIAAIHGLPGGGRKPLRVSASEGRL
jgi:TniQ